MLHKYQLYELLQLRNDNKETCAHTACFLNKSEELKEMLRHGIDVNSVDIKGDTILHVAIQENYKNCIQTILNTNKTIWDNKIAVNLSLLNDNGCAPLHLAIKNRNFDVFKLIVDKAHDMNVDIFETIEGKHGSNALHIAIDSNATDIAHYLIERNVVDPNKVNQSGHTALYLAKAAKADELVCLMQKQCLVDTNENSVDNEDDCSSRESFESTSSEKKFDDPCFTELSSILNQNSKWKSLATKLGYVNSIEKWQSFRNPTKILLLYSQVNDQNTYNSIRE